MGQYDKKGGYAGYKKNNKEREAFDYYATPTKEVENILNLEQIQFFNNNITILEPCCGGGHMVQGIINHLEKTNNDKHIELTMRDYINRKPEILLQSDNISIKSDFGLDFLSDDYPKEKYDYVIMNPPFSTIEPFVLRALELTKHKLIMFGRTKFIEGVNRYNNIFINHPPTRVYQYIERVVCAKNGDFTQKLNSIEANAWFVWDLDDPNFGKYNYSTLLWMHRN